MIRKIIAALAVSLLISCSTVESYESRPIETLSPSQFTVVETSKPFMALPREASPESTATPTPKPTPKPTKKPTKPKTRQVIFDGGILKGKATYFCNYTHPEARRSSCHYLYPDRRGKLDLYAAAGPKLRKMLGSKWRNDQVKVCRGSDCVIVRLIDWCGCRKGHPDERIIDLYSDAFKELSYLGRGKLIVRVYKQ